MYCRQCGHPMVDDESFCTQCGTPVAVDNSPVESVPIPQETPYYYDPAWQREDQTPPSQPFLQNQTDMPLPYQQPIAGSAQPKNRKKALAIVLIAVGCVLALAAGVLVPVLIEKDRADRYGAAKALMDDGEYEEAIAAFSEMGEYKESPEMAMECQNTIDYNAAQALMTGNQFEQARDAFTALGSFRDAPALAEECQHTLDYNAAVALMNEDKLDSARDAFLALGDFMGAQEMAAQCQQGIDYDAAVAMMSAGQYAEAMSAFKALGDFSDAADQAAVCQRNIDYFAADEAYQSGFYYTAYAAFLELGDFGDSAARAEQCIQPAPENGEMYHNPDFAKKLSFTIKNQGKTLGLLIKIYSEDYALVSITYIAPGKKVKIRLQRGEYTVNVGWGTQWFGDKEYFGSNAFYGAGNDGMLFEISSGYYYTYELTTPEPGEVYQGPITYSEF